MQKRHAEGRALVMQASPPGSAPLQRRTTRRWRLSKWVWAFDDFSSLCSLVSSARHPRCNRPPSWLSLVCSTNFPLRSCPPFPNSYRQCARCSKENLAKWSSRASASSRLSSCVYLNKISPPNFRDLSQRCCIGRKIRRIASSSRCVSCWNACANVVVTKSSKRACQKNTWHLSRTSSARRHD